MKLEAFRVDVRSCKRGSASTFTVAAARTESSRMGRVCALESPYGCWASAGRSSLKGLSGYIRSRPKEVRWDTMYDVN